MYILYIHIVHISLLYKSKAAWMMLLMPHRALEISCAVENGHVDIHLHEPAMIITLIHVVLLLYPNDER